MNKMQEREKELKEKRICRFCMTQQEPLTNIHSKENRIQSVVPLPVQILACTSIEVFTNDSLPSTICEACRIMMDYFYRFKQICKTADTKLKQYPLTGEWPIPIELPKISTPDKMKPSPSGNLKLIQRTSPAASSPPVSTLKRSSVTSTVQPTPVKKIKKETPTVSKPQPLSPDFQSESSTPVKLLNKVEPKILNKNVNNQKKGYILSTPVLKTDSDGKVEIISEVLDENDIENETDPTKNVEPVETNIFPCTECERSFPLKQLLDIHMKNHTRARNFECEVCMKRFFSKYDLGKHMAIHTGAKPYVCVICQKGFSRSTLLTRHERTHIDQPKFLCVHCERPFLSEEDLEAHVEKTHRKNRPFTCDVCGKAFAFKQGMERHQMIHEKFKPYPCEHCSKSFTTPNKLARHLTAHAGKRPYPCKLCYKSFLLSHHLTRHLRSHTNEETYNCNKCNLSFNYYDLVTHSSTHAQETLSCPLCKEQFNSLDDVTDHINLHAANTQFRCDYCDLIFISVDKLEAHCLSDHAEDHRGNEIIQEGNSKSNDLSMDSDEEESYVLEEIDESDSSNIRIISEQQDISDLINSNVINLNNKNANKDNQVEVLAEFEIRRSSRPNKSRNYAQLIKSELATDDGEQNTPKNELSDDDDDHDEYNNEEEDDDDDDDDVEIREIGVKKSKNAQQGVVQQIVKLEKVKPKELPMKKKEPEIKKPTTKTIPELIQMSPTQEKITKFIKRSTKQGLTIISERENSVTKEENLSKIKEYEIEKVLKNLPKCVTIIKTETSDETDKSPKKKNSNTIQSNSSSQQTNQNNSMKKPNEPLKNRKSDTKTEISNNKTSDGNVGKSSPSTSKIINKNPEPPQKKLLKESPKYSSNELKTQKPKEQTQIGKQSENMKKSNESNPSSSSAPVKTFSKLINTNKSDISEMKIGDKMVKVQKIKMTRTQVDAMKKEGKIEIKDGAIILKTTPGNKKDIPQSKKIIKSTTKPVVKGKQ